MRSSVYDTMLVGKANGLIQGRRAGTALDRRLGLLQSAVLGATQTLVNGKLLGEYDRKVRQVAIRNEIVRAFLEYVIDFGVDSRRSTLAGAYIERAKKARWPVHDYHLLAAAIDQRRVSIYVTETRHAECAGAVLKQFGFRVVPS